MVNKINFHISPKKPIAGWVHLSIKDPDVNWFVGEKLRAEKPCSCTTLSHGSEATAFYTSFYKYICQIVNKKNILTCSHFGIGGGTYNMVFGSNFTSSNIMAIYRAITKALKTTSNMFAIYSNEIYLLGAKPNRDEFNHYLQKLAQGNITLNIMVDAKTKAKLVDRFQSNDLKASSSPTSNKAPASLKEPRIPSSYTTVKVGSAWKSTTLAYILNSTFKIPSLQSGADLVVYHEGALKKKKTQMTKSNFSKALSAKFEKVAFKDFKSNLTYFLVSQASEIPATYPTVDKLADEFAKLV